MCAAQWLEENIKDVRRFGYSRFEVKFRILVLQGSVWLTTEALRVQRKKRLLQQAAGYQTHRDRSLSHPLRLNEEINL
jgi:hypothetical protein